jgi:hypothetical protein
MQNFDGKPLRKWPLGRLRKRWKDTINMDLMVRRWEVVGNGSGFCDGNVESSGSDIRLLLVVCYPTTCWRDR